MAMFVKPTATVAKPLGDVDFKGTFNIKHDKNVFVGQGVNDSRVKFKRVSWCYLEIFKCCC